MIVRSRECLNLSTCSLRRARVFWEMAAAHNDVYVDIGADVSFTVKVEILKSLQQKPRYRMKTLSNLNKI